MITQSQAIDQLHGAASRMCADLQVIPPERWSVPPRPGVWSPADVAEHVILASSNMRGVFDGIADRPIGEKLRALCDEEIPFVFYGGGDEPPGIADPTGALTDRDQAAAQVASATQELSDRALAAQVDLRTVAGTHPVFGRMDGVQWLIFAFAHIERHRADLRSAVSAG